METLYTKQGSKLRQWTVFTESDEVVVQHGQVGGKLTEKRYKATPKNESRSNATSATEQALLEAEAKVVKQLKSGYYKTQAEAKNHTEWTPVKAQNSDDQKHKLVYPCYVEEKLNGQRCLINAEGEALSKQGESLSYPAHWKGIEAIAERFSGIDGEIFAGTEQTGGLSLQKIISAFRKPNADTPKLKLYVYDIPIPDTTMEERVKMLEELFVYVKDNGIPYIEVVLPETANSWEEVVKFSKKAVVRGYEGGIARNKKGLYEFGKRSYDLQKVKFRQSAEAVVVSVTQDKNSDGVLLCQAINGKQTGVQFECLMRKDADENINYRKYSNALLLIGKAVTYEYEELSDKRIPTKPCGVAIREVLSNGEPRY